MWARTLNYPSSYIVAWLDDQLKSDSWKGYTSHRPWSKLLIVWPSSGDLPRPRIGMLSLVTVSPVITAFHSCCLSHHSFDQVNLWPAWVGIEIAIFWQCSPGTVETQRLYPLRHGPRRPEVKFGRDVVKEETTQKLPRWGQKVRNK